ncbi:MAG: UrcA family protein [Hyphomonadaceae bacterium]|nr:UrcA family protein [Hyphomonadaceae bacterium]
MKRFALSVAAVIALGAASPPAQAEIAPLAVRAVQVQTADFDLAKQGDVAALLSRIGLAATRACEADASYWPSTVERRAVRTCREEAVARTVTEINAPALTQMYLERRVAESSQIASR